MTNPMENMASDETKIIIKKLSEEITYIEKSVKYVFEVNGKKVGAWAYDKQDQQFDNYESNSGVEDEDLKQLTDLENEAIDENLTDAMDLKEGEEMTIDL